MVRGELLPAPVAVCCLFQFLQEPRARPQLHVIHASTAGELVDAWGRSTRCKQSRRVPHGISFTVDWEHEHRRCQASGECMGDTSFTENRKRSNLKHSPQATEHTAR